MAEYIKIKRSVGNTAYGFGPVYEWADTTQRPIASYTKAVNGQWAVTLYGASGTPYPKHLWATEAGVRDIIEAHLKERGFDTCVGDLADHRAQND